MKKISLCGIATFVPFLAIGCSGSSSSEEQLHWSYRDATGPEHWGSLEEDYALCDTGTHQSPVNLTGSTANGNLSDISFSYQEASGTLRSNGHALQFDYPEGSTVAIDSQVYALKQFHFHTPSEHALGLLSWPLEVHFVHRDSDGNLAVVGVLFHESETESPLLAQFLDKIEMASLQVDVTLNAAIGLPEQKKPYYAYSGSLTTPPCSEGVTWRVLGESVPATPEQLNAITSVFIENARPTQPLNGRVVERAP